MRPVAPKDRHLWAGGEGVWADPAAALIVGTAAAREAVENWHEANDLDGPS
ncbi:MAG: hypothetical protein P1T08_06975 [Acidimicrobiia bacterium]|nr:hypothetical protein [Acidimicrobiia bacterium]